MPPLSYLGQFDDAQCAGEGVPRRKLHDSQYTTGQVVSGKILVVDYFDSLIYDVGIIMPNAGNYGYVSSWCQG